MVMRAGIGDPEADRHGVEEAGALEIPTDVEYDLVGSRAERFALEQRLIRSAIKVRNRAHHRNGCVFFKTKKLYLDPSARLAVRGVEHVRGEPAHQASIFRRRPSVMWPICSSALASSL